MKRKLFFGVIILFACSAARAQQQTVRFNTGDGCALEAFYLAPSSGSYVFINTHGLGSDKNEWAGFQAALAARGLGYLSLDMRGHGASLKCAGKAVSYRAFSKVDWNNISRDITAAAAWLRKKKIPASRLVFCGASIGANLSLKAAAEAGIKPAAVILLSPGLEYAGVKAEPYYAAAQPLRIFIAASEDDPYAWQSGNYLAAAAKGLPAHFVAGAGGHGVNMFKGPGLMSGIIDWVSGPAQSAAVKN